MKREIYSRLLEWKDNIQKKPLILQGARQVGKTWLINEFGRNEYKRYYRFNFEEDDVLTSYFEGNLDPVIIIEKLSLHINERIIAENTLIFFDEVQVAPRVLTSLKYFQEKAPQFHIIAAGSLLGISIGKQSGFPVGKVNFLDLFPLSFYEFLIAMNEDLLADKIFLMKKIHPLDDVFHDKLIHYLKLFLYLGGMPEVVQDYVLNKDPVSARKIQNDIIKSYRNDFSKYNTPLHAIKILEIWDSIPYQIAKENKKFKYSDVKHRARASMYESAIHWLKNAGMVFIVDQLRDIKLPLNGYTDAEKFKLFLLDTGLLGALLKITSDMVLDPAVMFREYNGAFVENYVCVELKKAFEAEIHYWTYDRGIAEVDFIFQYGNEIVPIEVKSGTNKNTLSLRTFESKYKPGRIWRASPRNLHQSDNFTNIPLYWIYALNAFLKNE